jgi:hypothetical protein
MNADIALILAMDGLANGAVYLLAGLGLVLVFSVTRVVFVPFGDIAAFAALSLAAFETGGTPATIGLVATLAVLATATELASLARRGEACAHAARDRSVGVAAGRAVPDRLGLRAARRARRAAGRRLGAARGPNRAAARPRGVPADRRRLRAGAADRLARAALPAVGARPAVLRP